MSSAPSYLFSCRSDRLLHFAHLTSSRFKIPDSNYCFVFTRPEPAVESLPPIDVEAALLVAEDDVKKHTLVLKPQGRFVSYSFGRATIEMDDRELPKPEMTWRVVRISLEGLDTYFQVTEDLRPNEFIVHNGHHDVAVVRLSRKEDTSLEREKARPVVETS